MYYKYFKYIIQHKKNVFKECVKMSRECNMLNRILLLIHGITHDFSKFSSKEFIPYAKYFYKKEVTKEDKNNFDKAWKHHYSYNKHHWKYWEESGDIPIRYILQMICDWKAMGVKFNNTTQEYYLKEYDNIKVNNHTRINIEYFLKLNDYPIYKSTDPYIRYTLKEVLEMYVDYKKNHSEDYNDTSIKKYISDINELYNIDVLELLKISEKDIYK